MLVGLLIPSLVVLLFYIYTSETKKSDSKQHFRSIFDPSGIVRIFILYFLLLITGQRESVLLRSISFLLCFASVSFLVFFLMSVFIEKLRKRYDAGTVSSLWLLPIFCISISAGHLKCRYFVPSLSYASITTKYSVSS